MRISNVPAVMFVLLHCSSQISNQGRKGAWIHFKFGTFCPAAGKPEKSACQYNFNPYLAI